MYYVLERDTPPHTRHTHSSHMPVTHARQLSEAYTLAELDDAGFSLDELKVCCKYTALSCTYLAPPWPSEFRRAHLSALAFALTHHPLTRPACSPRQSRRLQGTA